MLEILKFIFTDFWHWAGTVVLLALIVGGVVGSIQGLVRINIHRHKD